MPWRGTSGGASPGRRPGFWHAIAEGAAEAARSEQIWPVLLLNFGVGVFYVGPFMSILPLAVRDVYHGGAAELSYVNFAFWAATIVTGKITPMPKPKMVNRTVACSAVTRSAK